jgi:phosphoribosylformylglycinamidine synthase subunit PurQ / glutaminase
MKPRALILRTAGTNCDVETAHAFELVGAQSVLMHLNRLLEDPEQLQTFQILAIPGGFSYGDDIAAGRIFANQMAHHLHDPLHEFIAAGKPIIGICNGFQVLVKTDLLPGPLAGLEGQNCTLTNNDCGRLVDRWVRLAPRSKKCVWTADLEQTIELPVAHGEGKFVPADQNVRELLWKNDQVALVYVRADGSAAEGQFPDNPNGSVDDIAGICDQTGLVFGLMPHPERHLISLQHPAWSRLHSGSLAAPGAGVHLFRSAVEHAIDAVGIGA